MSETLITSPVGNIVFCALNRRVTKKPSDTEPTVYSLTVEFDGSTAEGKAFKEQIEAINPNLLGTKHATTPENFTVKATTKFDVEVYTSAGGEVTKLEGAAVPSVEPGGRAAMVIKPYTKNTLGGSIYLTAAYLHEFTEHESGGETANDRHQRIADAIKSVISS